MVFPGAIYGCDSWTIKKPEHWRTATWKLGWRILLRVPWTAKRLNQSILKENQPWIWIRRTGAEAEGLILWLTDVKSQLSGKEPNVGQDWRQKEKGAAEDEMVRQHHWINGYQFVSVHSLSRIWLSVTPWTAARQASLSITNSQSLFKLMSIEQWCHPTVSSYVVPFSSCLQSFPASGSFQMSQFFASGGQSTGVSASELLLPMNVQNWFSLGLIGLMSWQNKGLSRVFSYTIV